MIKDGGWRLRPTTTTSVAGRSSRKTLVEKMAELEAKMAAMERRMLGPKSEKLPPMDREVRKQRPVDPAATQEKRRKNAELRATRVETETVEHKVL